MKEHPLSYTFPHMSESDFETLKSDIEQNGQVEPIVIYQGQILDGRHRNRACRELGINPKTVPLPDTADPLAWVISKNLHRRHLKTGQRAAIGAEQVTTSHGGDRRSRDKFSPWSVTDAAKAVGVSPATIKKALYIRKSGTPKQFEALKAGRVNIDEAVRLVKKDTERSVNPWKRKPVPKAVHANTQPAQRLTPDVALNMIQTEVEGRDDPHMVDVLHAVLTRVTESQCQTMPLSDVTIRTMRAVARVASTVICEGSTIRGVSDSGSMLAVGDLDHEFEQRLVIPDFPAFVKTVAALKVDAIRWNYRQRSAIVGPVTFQFEQAEARLREPEDFEALVDVLLLAEGVRHVQASDDKSGDVAFRFEGDELCIRDEWSEAGHTVNTDSEVSKPLETWYELDHLRRLPEADLQLQIGRNMAVFDAGAVKFYVATLNRDQAAAA